MPNSISNEEVQSAGSSWIICRSKSYINRIYYFNTITGEALWDLSEAEMEKARKATKNFAKSNSIAIDNCPEPLGSPEDYVHKNKDIKNENKLSPTITPKVYNKQSISNQLIKAHNVPSMNSMQFGIAVPSMYNPLLWNIPPQPVIITQIDQTDYSVTPNINTYIPVSGTNVPLSTRFKSSPGMDNTKSSSFNKQNLIEFTDEERSNSVNSMGNNKNNKKNTTKLDLREILSAKRRSNRNLESSPSTFDGETACKRTCKNSKNENTLLNMRDDEWLVENLRSNLYSNLDTSELRKLVNLGNKTGFWYIVTDTNVLLNNTNFLKVLLHSDKQCILILPRAVVDEIQRFAESKPQAQKAAYFISQQVDLNQVVIDEESLGDNTFYIQDEILGCCSRLSEQGCPVALITNNIEILHLKEKVTYHIITIREVKMLSCHLRTPSMNYLPLNDAKANIKITIPNGCDDIFSKNEETNYIVTDNGSNRVISTSPNFVIEEEAKDRVQPVCYEQKNITNNDRLVSEGVLGNNNNTPYVTKNKLEPPISHDSLNSVSNEVQNFKGRRKNTKIDNLDETKSGDTNENSCHSRSSEFKESQSTCNVNIVANEINSDTADCLKDFNISSDDTTMNNSNIQQPSSNNSSKDDKNVMFEITSQAMEENLRMKSDEWVSRFTQIMEEVLTLVLNKEPKFVCEAMPPPWSLYEATECTRKKFHNDCDIVDAANKFRNILFDVGGSRGKVKTNISPQQYMEVYSYGVYLTDALQGALNDCEDLQTAAETLSKLLSDIQDANLDISDQNLFGSSTKEENAKTSNNKGNENKNSEKQLFNESNLEGYQLKDVPQISLMSDESQQNTANTIKVVTPVKCKIYKSDEALSSSLKYNLRSSRRSTPQKTQITTNSESCFFNSLRLTKRRFSDIDHSKNQEPSAEENLNKINEYDEIDNGHIVSYDNSEQTDSVINKDTKFGEDKNIEPVIIRKFVKCFDIEDRIKNNDLKRDVDVSFNEEDDEGYDFDNPYNVSDYMYYESEMDGVYPFENDELYDFDEEYMEEENIMNGFIENIIKESKDVLSLVKMFCEKCYDVLKSSPNDFNKSEILQEAVEAHTNIFNICDTLDRILKRETRNCEDSIRAVSKKLKLNIFEISEEEVQNYRNVITKCLEQGSILKESVTMIINAVKLNA